MGFVNVKVQVSNPWENTKAEEIEFLVDSRAIYSPVPRNILEDIGIEPKRILT